MKEVFFLIIALFLFVACNHTDRIAKNGAKTISTDVKGQEVGINELSGDTMPVKKNNKIQIPQQEKVHGIKQEGPFKMYTTMVGQGEGYYNGLPKVEILDRNNEVVKSIDVLNNTTLFEGSEVEYEFDRNQGEGYFNVRYDGSKNLLKYVNTRLFPKPSYAPSLLLEMLYEVQNDVLLCKYTYFALEPEGFDLYGSESEVVLIDTLGHELGRAKVEGPLSGIGITKDHKMLYLSTGGEINEDAFHPYACRIYNMKNQEIIFSRKGENGECLGCGVIENSNRGVMTVTSNSSCSNQFAKETHIFDHIQNKVFLSTFFNGNVCPGGGFQIWEDYCFCFSVDDKKHTFYYEKDFDSRKFIKNN